MIHKLVDPQANELILVSDVTFEYLPAAFGAIDAFLNLTGRGVIIF
jgi:hypothetical protein